MAGNCLTFSQRREIERLYAAGARPCEIAEAIGVTTTTGLKNKNSYLTKIHDGVMLSMQKPMTEKSSRISGLSESGAFAVSAAVSDAGEWTQEGSETNSRVCARYSAAA